MSEGFYKRRRGILEHIESGKIDLLESGIHDYLSLKANLVIGSTCSIPVGIVFTSAPAIHVHCKRVSERTIQRVLEHLEAIGWIKMFKTPGKRGNYPTLLCRASVHDLSGNEYRINGVKTVDWRHPVYEPVGEVSGSCRESVGKLSSDREEREEKKEERVNQNHPKKKRDDAVSGPHFSKQPPKDIAKKALLRKYPKEEAFIDAGLQMVEIRAHNSGASPESPSYFISAYENLRGTEPDWQLVSWYVQNPKSSDRLSRVNSLIRKAEAESKRTGRGVIDIFHDLRQDPRCYEIGVGENGHEASFMQ